MRHTHDGMIEFIDAIKIDGEYFVRIQVPAGGFTYQFGIGKSGYNTIKRVFQYRPFDKLAAEKYRFFYRSAGKSGKGEVYIKVLFEQNLKSKSFDIIACKNLASNLVWFNEVKDLAELEHLRIEI